MNYNAVFHYNRLFSMETSSCVFFKDPIRLFQKVLANKLKNSHAKLSLSSQASYAKV